MSGLLVVAEYKKLFTLPSVVITYGAVPVTLVTFTKSMYWPLKYELTVGIPVVGAPPAKVKLYVVFVIVGVPVILKPLLICSAYKPGVPVVESAVLDIAVFITTFKASPNHWFKFWVLAL